MKILVAGATGALGIQLVPRLVAKGHDVAGLVHRVSKLQAVRDLGATPLVADALHRDRLAAAVAEFEPDVIVHELTALADGYDIRHVAQTMAATNRLRTEATDNLLAAGRAASVRRFVAQSFAGSGLPFARQGGAVKSEADPIDPHPVEALRSTIEALRHLEDEVTGAHWTQGIVLRYGNFYGPGTSITKGGALFRAIQNRQLPLIGDGDGVWSFVHIADAAEATVAAVEHGHRGIYHIVDDDPAPVKAWLPAVAAALGARPPYHLPRWLGRLIAGEAATVMMTEARGASNAKAKRDLDWRPKHMSWRSGFAAEAA